MIEKKLTSKCDKTKKEKKTWQNSKLKMWQNSETEIVNELKMENVAKILKIWQNSKTQNETKPYNSICDWSYTLKMW